MKCLEIRLYPQSPFPLIISADTLFGAICSACVDLGYPVENMISMFNSKRPPFLLSSAFPFVKSGPYYFFPMPILQSVSFPVNESTLEGQKKVKSARFVHKSIFIKMIQGQLTEKMLIEQHESYELYHGFLFPNIKQFSLQIDDRDFPHNTINRVSGHTEEFFYHQAYSFQNSGLFLYVKIFDQKYEEILFSAFRLLQDRGIGKRISTGMGQFRFECVPNPKFFEDTNIENPPFFLTLSRYIPSSDEFSGFSRDLWYHPVPLIGRSADGIMKKQVIMLQEGSVFKHLRNKHYGSLVCVRDISGSPAVSYGFAFPVPFGKEKPS